MSSSVEYNTVKLETSGTVLHHLAVSVLWSIKRNRCYFGFSIYYLKRFLHLVAVDVNISCIVPTQCENNFGNSKRTPLKRFDGLWLWISWQSGCFRFQRSKVRIQSLAILAKRRKEQEKRPGMAKFKKNSLGRTWTNVI